jgi:hypothetical protein
MRHPSSSVVSGTIQSLGLQNSMDNDAMAVHWLTLIISASLTSLPLLAVCVVGIVAALRSRVLPQTAIKLAVGGFGCIVAYVIVSALGQYAAIILRAKAESPSVLGLQLASIGLLQIALLTVGVAIVGRAIFSGRKNET